MQGKGEGIEVQREERKRVYEIEEGLKEFEEDNDMKKIKLTLIYLHRIINNSWYMMSSDAKKEENYRSLCSPSVCMRVTFIVTQSISRNVIVIIVPIVTNFDP